MYCSKCGKQNPGDSRYCQKCGAPFSPPTPPVQQKAQPFYQPVFSVPFQPPAQHYPARRPGRRSGPGKIIAIVSAAVLGLCLIIFGIWGIGTLVENNRPLTVTELSDTPPEDCVSPLYQLTSGPKAAQEPYTFTYDVGDIALGDGDVLFVGIGLSYISDGQGGEILSYLPLEAELNNGVASATFVPADYLDAKTEIRSSGDTTQQRRLVEGLCLGLYYTHTFVRPTDNSLPGHFRLIVSPNAIKTGLVTEAIAVGVLTDLENAYQFYNEMGYSFAERTRWPLDVKMAAMGETSGEYVPMRLLNFSSMGLNILLFSNLSDDIDAPRFYNAGDNFPLVVHEMGHFMQDCNMLQTLSCIWTDEACSTYYEWVTGGDITSIVDANRNSVLQGVYPTKSTGDAGYGRAPLFQYLEEYVHPGFVQELYTGTTYGYGTSGMWADAITAICGSPSTYASDYYNKLLTGKLSAEIPAKTVYGLLVSAKQADNALGKVAALQLPAAGTSLDTLFPGGSEHMKLAEYTVSAYGYGPQFLALKVDSGTLPDGTELWVYGSDGSAVSAYRINGDNTDIIPGDSTSVDLDDFSSQTAAGSRYLIQLVGLHNTTTEAKNYKLTVMLYKTGEAPPITDVSPDSTPDTTDTAAPSVGPDTAAQSPSPSAAVDPCADAIPEVGGVQFDRFDDPTPNARSGGICPAPYMRIDAFNIIGGRLTKPEVSNNVNEAFTYINKGYCTAGETVGLQMIASARDREQDSIEYNIIENRLTLRITFYDKDGKIIGTPLEQSSPENGKEHTIGDSISAVVPENAGSVNLSGYFNHKYGCYGDINGSSVGISVSFAVTDFDVNASAVQTDLIGTSGSGAGDDADDAEECEQFWKSMQGVWMLYNSVGEVEYFHFTGSGGGKSLVIGTVETGRSEPSQAISVSKYSELEFLVIYRYEGVDYKLYFEVSDLGDGFVYYAAHNPSGYRAFDYVGKDMSEAMAYYSMYYAVG